MIRNSSHESLVAGSKPRASGDDPSLIEFTLDVCV